MNAARTMFAFTRKLTIRINMGSFMSEVPREFILTVSMLRRGRSWPACAGLPSALFWGWMIIAKMLLPPAYAYFFNKVLCGVSVPRLRPYINNAGNNPVMFRKSSFTCNKPSFIMPYAGITISTRERPLFLGSCYRNGRHKTRRRQCWGGRTFGRSKRR